MGSAGLRVTTTYDWFDCLHVIILTNPRPSLPHPLNTDMLKRAPIFKRIKVWKKYKGNIPVVGAGAMRGQAAAIMQGAYVEDVSICVCACVCQVLPADLIIFIIF